MVKIIKAVGSPISTDRLEKASVQLLLARIRGSEPQVSFNFIQRLLDELIQRRHQEELEKLELSALAAEFTSEIASSDTKELPKPLVVASTDDLNYSSDEIIVCPPQEIEFPEYDDCDIPPLDSSFNVIEDKLQEPPIKVEEFELDTLAQPELIENTIEKRPKPVEEKSPRKPLPLRKQKRSVLSGDVSLWRVLVITLISAFAMLCFAILA